ncbi:MAG: AI-2E family transporter [Alphaproteobacteria bacterium]|nr:MAG: AI-2E family transporter [Alphaproteobacteria bacterium]TAF41921.1 MAG: AI-2E family transporter [Alphaproteobacteria bacterium]TAF76776.1 MAG: AI-2E family transporter [Alphaproteobacteria bacterium]
MIRSNSTIIFWILITCLVGYFIDLISPVLLPFVLGLGVAYVLDPFTDRLERLGLSRTVATAVICGIFALAVVVLFLIVVPLVVDQVRGLIEEFPYYLEVARSEVAPYLKQWGVKSHMYSKKALQDFLTEQAGGAGQDMVLNVARGVLRSGLVLVNIAALFVITPVVSFYLLRDWDVMVARIDTLLPRPYAPIIREQLAIVDRTLAAFVRGQINVIIVLVLYYSVALTIAGLPNSLLVALVAGCMVVIPYVGTIVSGSLALGLAYVQIDQPNLLFIVLGIFIIGQMFEGYFLTPKLIGTSVGLNPIWIIFGMMAGGAIMGFVGILIAVPLTAVMGVVIRFAVAEYLKSRYYTGANTPNL